MNNANVALNIARPVSQAPSSASAKATDDTTPSKRFDAVLGNAHAQVHAQAHASTHATPHADAGRAAARTDNRNDARTAKQDAGDDKDADAGATSHTAAADDKSAAAKQDATAAKDEPNKDDASDDDHSIATTMLALIGVPPKVTELATKTLGALKDAGGKTGDLTAGALAMGLPLADGVPAPAGGDAAKALLTSTDTSASSGVLAATASPVAVSPLATLLAARAAVTTGAKDDVASDPTASPMPLVHTPGLAPVDGAMVQVQATQAATAPQFAQELGEQIAWMGSGQIKEARIKLHPEELGSMDVRVSMEGGKVNVAILAQHPAAVHAVQQTLSQLDSMLAHHGLSLGQADVGQQQAGQGRQGTSDGGNGQGGTDEPAVATVLATSRVSRGLVDERA
ncbi:flagellar hook-length control protein FliK [Luteibacter sp. 9135]|uniref:flagellar hook-length control protein FliK n=1 Tax=Luteibacter sp. 9135 TaxID=1500893 RepID=UPI00055F2EF0|nr:flagellar hook-length control protein FliK [Luteibacter sp. 9135]